MLERFIACTAGLNNIEPARTFSIAENVAKVRLRIINCDSRISSKLQRNRLLRLPTNSY